jgi:hypothetical protein
MKLSCSYVREGGESSHRRDMQENVEIVRGYYEDIDRTLKAYWANPEVPLSKSAETEAIIERLDPGYYAFFAFDPRWIRVEVFYWER